MKKLTSIRKNYYDYLDSKAKYLASLLITHKKMTRLLLDYIEELYTSAKIEREFSNDFFKSSYHNPVTSELEFLIARILYHYSIKKDLGWKIYLRSQVKKTAPDIRIVKDNKTLALIEIKAKIGWMQVVFSQELFAKDLAILKSGKNKYDPRVEIEKFKYQINKHCKAHEVSKDRFFLFLPSLYEAHRRGSKYKVEDYEKDFIKNFSLPEENFVLLSRNLEFEVGRGGQNVDYKSTDHFERMVQKIER